MPSSKFHSKVSKLQNVDDNLRVHVPGNGAKSSQHSQTSAQLSRAGNTPEVFAVVLGAAADLSLSPSHKMSSNKTKCHRVSKCPCRGSTAAEAAARHRDQCQRVARDHDRNCQGGTCDKSLRAAESAHTNRARQQFYKICVSNRQKPAASIKQQTATMSIYGVWVSSIKHQSANSKHVHPGRFQFRPHNWWTVLSERPVQRFTGWV